MQPQGRRHQKPHLKKHRRSFKLHRFCFITLNLSNVREFFASWVLKVCISVKKKNDKENRCLVSTFSMKREFKEFHVVVVQWRQRNKNTWCTSKVVVSFSYLKPRSRVAVFVWKRIFFFSGWAYLSHSLMHWNWSPETHLFKNALPNLDFWKRTRLFFYVWTDENGFEFGIRWCQTSYILPA